MKFYLFLVGVLLHLANGQDQPDNSTTTETPPETTTSPETTTTPPETTTIPPTTPAPEPKDYYYISDDKGVMCMMFEGSITFNVEYGINPKGTNKTEISLPKPAANVTVSGDCSSKEQSMKISWGPSAQQYIFNIQFELSKDKEDWNISYVEATIPIEDTHFTNASDEGKNIFVNASIAMKPDEVPVNRSFSCIEMVGDKITANLDTKTQEYTHPITLNIDGLQVQAYNQVKGDKFEENIHCYADKSSDIVPIAVGCALGGLVIVVMIVYVVGRHRRSAAYQSV